MRARDVDLYRVKSLANGQIMHLVFDTQRNLCQSMLRIEEFYESPKFANKYFTLEEYKEWYKASRNQNKFTYYSDWAGFNIPAPVVRDFFDIFRNDLSQIEAKILLDLFADARAKYLIASFDGEKSEYVVEHEIAHAAFSIDPKYKDRALAIVHSLGEDKLDSEISLMRIRGYAAHVIFDEIHAYAVDKDSKLPCAQEIRANFLNWLSNQ